MLRTFISFVTTTLISASLAFGTFGTAVAKEINWYISDFFPCHVLKGPQHGLGYCDDILEHIIKSLPQYQHHVEHVVLSKLVTAPDLGDSFCTLQLLKTPEREKRFNFTDYYLVVGQNGIFTRKDDDRFSSYLIGEKTISLQKLLRSTQLILAVDKSRSYGKVIDALLMEVDESLPQVSLNSDAKYVELLKSGRVDFTIAYPTELHDRNTGLPQSDLTFLYIAEPQQQDYVHASCSKSVDNRILNDINNVVLAFRDNLFRDFYNQWLPDSAY